MLEIIYNVMAINRSQLMLSSTEAVTGEKQGCKVGDVAEADAAAPATEVETLKFLIAPSGYKHLQPGNKERHCPILTDIVDSPALARSNIPTWVSQQPQQPTSPRPAG